MERRQLIVIGVNEQGELVWGHKEMELWQRKMFPIRYAGDFSSFWQKLQLLQEADLEFDAPNFGGFQSHVPWQLADKYDAEKCSRQSGD